MKKFLCGLYVPKENKALTVGYIQIPDKEEPVFIITMNKFIDIKNKFGNHCSVHPCILFNENTAIRNFAERWKEGHTRTLREDTYERLITELSELRKEYKNILIEITEENEKEYVGFLDDEYALKSFSVCPYKNFIKYNELNMLRNKSGK